MNKFEPANIVKTSKSDMTQGRRKYPRRNLNNKVGVLLAGKYQIFEGLIIGEGGLSIRSSESFPPYSEVLLTFKIPKGNITIIRAIVKNQLKLKSDPKFLDIGIQFVDLQFADKRLIRTFVAARSESETIE